MIASSSWKGVLMLALRTVQDIDKDLRNLRNIVSDTLRDSDPWNIAWERINELLEERTRLLIAKEELI